MSRAGGGAWGLQDGGHPERFLLREEGLRIEQRSIPKASLLSVLSGKLDAKLFRRRELPSGVARARARVGGGGGGPQDAEGLAVVGVAGLQGDDVLHERDGAGQLAPLGEERREVEHGGGVVRLQPQALAAGTGGALSDRRAPI